MADIFVSYAQLDKARVQPLVTLLEAQGWTVWWDTRINAGERWDEVIEREIRKARCIVVVWSSVSVSRRWVREEANYGLERGILVPVIIDDVTIPVGYALVQGLKMVGWRGTSEDPVTENLIASISSKLAESALSLRLVPQRETRVGWRLYPWNLLGKAQLITHRYTAIVAALAISLALGLFYLLWEPFMVESESTKAHVAIAACNTELALDCAKRGGIFGSDEALAGLRSCKTSELYRSDDPLLQWVDVWTTSVYSFAPGGGGPGGGLDDDVLKAGGWGDWYFTLIKFNLPSLRERPRFAAMALYSKTDQLTGVRIEVDQIIKDWSFPKGDRLWWKDRPGARAITTEPLPAPFQDRWYLIDLTKLMQQWFDGKSPNFGLQIRPASNFGNLVVFVSSDAVDKSKIPRLIVCY